MNLDQAVENFKYLLAIDIRELISLEDVMRGAPREFGDKVGDLHNFYLHLEARVEDQDLVVEVVAMVLDQLIQPSSNGFSFIYFSL